MIARWRAGRRERRYWRVLLARFGVPGVRVLDVIQAGEGCQVHGRLGRPARRQLRTVTREDIRDLGPRIAVHKRLPQGSVWVEEDPPGSQAADFIIHVPQEMARESVCGILAMTEEKD